MSPFGESGQCADLENRSFLTRFGLRLSKFAVMHNAALAAKL